MIITNVCLLLEALSIVICLHHLYGEKFRLDIATVSLLAIDMILMQAIDYLGLPGMVSILIYPVIAIYCGIEFGFKLKPIIINIVLCVIIVGGMQLLIFSPICYLLDWHNIVHINSLVISVIVFIFVALLVPIVRVKRLSIFLQEKERILFISIVACLMLTFFIIIGYKKIKLMELNNTIILFSCVLLMLILSIKLIQYKIKAAEIETELKMHQLYSDSFQGLIDNIRMRQHEFDNHINAIYSLHFSCRTFEELVEAQNTYCKQITKENRFNKLLASGNSVIRGFLYTRFVEIDRRGIEIDYHVVLNEYNVIMPIFRIIEILGNLINNAVEALEHDEKRNKLYVEVMGTDRFFIEVRNESPYITYEMLEHFFSIGYSNKGVNRGLGLYNVKQICKEYDLKIAPEWIELDGEGWLSFKVWEQRE